MACGRGNLNGPLWFLSCNGFEHWIIHQSNLFLLNSSTVGIRILFWMPWDRKKTKQFCEILRALDSQKLSQITSLPWRNKIYYVTGLSNLNFKNIFSGRSKGGRKGRAPPPLDQNFFIFMQFSGKIGQIIGWRPPWGWRTLLWEILDPPLILTLKKFYVINDTRCTILWTLFEKRNCKIWIFIFKLLGVLFFPVKPKRHLSCL